MPEIKEISFADGLYIDTGGRIPPIHIKAKDFPQGSIAKVEAQINKLLQSYFEVKTAFPDYCEAPQSEWNLLPCERIEGNFVVTTWMWVKIHIYSLNPLRFNIRCSNPEYPIPDDWWK